MNLYLRILQDNVFLNTDNWDKWYTSFDVSNAGGTLMVGDNNGNVTLMTKEGNLPSTFYSSISFKTYLKTYLG